MKLKLLILMMLILIIGVSGCGGNPVAPEPNTETLTNQMPDGYYLYYQSPDADGDFTEMNMTGAPKRKLCKSRLKKIKEAL